MSDMQFLLSHYALVEVFCYLEYKDVLNVGQVCRTWFEASRNERVWQVVFRRHFSIGTSTIVLKQGRTWYDEFRRLHLNTPIIQTEVLYHHKHEVLHVSFSHAGEYFTTCFAGGFIRVWSSQYPAAVKFSKDMKMYDWYHAEFSEFNKSDTFLLVSGSIIELNGLRQSKPDEIAIFCLKDGLELVHRISSSLDHTLGMWYSNLRFISGQRRYVAEHETYFSPCLNTLYPEMDPCGTSTAQELFRFFNRDIKFINLCKVANYLKNDETSEETGARKNDPERAAHKDQTIETQKHRVVLQVETLSIETSQNGEDGHQENLNDQCEDISENANTIDCSTTDTDCMQEKYFIFATGCLKLLPHQIGFKRFKGIGAIRSNSSKSDGSVDSADVDDLESIPEFNDANMSSESSNSDDADNINMLNEVGPPAELNVPNDLNAPLDNIDVPNEFNEQPYELASDEWNTSDEMDLSYDSDDIDSMPRSFDQLDHVIEMNGEIYGMALSPDHRFLYVNTRPWRSDFKITHPTNKPPFIKQFDVKVIDLVKMTEVKTLSHPYGKCKVTDDESYLFLDASDDYVVSGDYDRRGHLWDRHYGIIVGKYMHTTLVNCMAFNPTDPEMLVTVSRDTSIKIWRSREKAREIKIQNGNINKLNIPKLIGREKKDSTSKSDTPEHGRI